MAISLIIVFFCIVKITTYSYKLQHKWTLSLSRHFRFSMRMQLLRITSETKVMAIKNIIYINWTKSVTKHLKIKERTIKRDKRNNKRYARVNKTKANDRKRRPSAVATVRTAPHHRWDNTSFMHTFITKTATTMSKLKP